MRVTAVRKGYFGGKIRDAGEAFDLPDALMGDGVKPSWVEAEGGARVASVDPETDGGPAARKRGRKPKQAASSAADEDGSAPSGNGLMEALGGPPPDWLPGDITE